MAFGILTTDRGDVRELTDASGTPFAFYSYDAYGDPTAKLSQATSLIGAQAAAAICSGNVVRYAGYVYDQESGLYYLSARCYDPSTASFLTKDPADADGEESPYQYCGGDPVGKVDPSGECVSGIVVTVVIVVVFSAVVLWPFVRAGVKSIKKVARARASARTPLDVINFESTRRGEVKKIVFLAQVPVQTYSYTDALGGGGTAIGTAIWKASSAVRKWVRRWRHHRR